MNGWIPIRFYWEAERPMVDWCLLGEERFVEPFFELTIERRLRHPFHHAFRRQTPAAKLREWHEASPGLEPAGFIFHMSRCGSTLLGRMLAAAPSNIVLSEPSPVDGALRSHFRHGSVSDEQRAQWLRWMVSAMGQKRHEEERRVFIKFDCWNIPELPIIRAAYPDVPWIFLYREPVEVLVSQLTQPAGWSFPGVLHPAVLGMSPAEVMDLPHDEYCARALARICLYALHYCRREGGLLVNYKQLPEIALTDLPAYFRTNYTDEERAMIREAARFDAKTPGLEFHSDAVRKRESATPRMKELAERWMRPAYEELERRRLASSDLQNHRHDERTALAGLRDVTL